MSSFSNIIYIYIRHVLKCGLVPLNANANARDESNANAQHLNQMQMHLDQMQMCSCVQLVIIANLFS